MEKELSRRELRAILAAPGSTPEQVIEAKLVLLRRITNGNGAITKICAKFGLSAEQTAETIASHHLRLGGLYALAQQDLARLERSLTQRHPPPETEQ